MHSSQKFILIWPFNGDEYLYSDHRWLERLQRLLMINTAKAYLQTEGNIEYRGCGINYYTYNMSNNPSRFKVVVNVELHHTQNDFVKTLNLDDDFEREEDAINYGIEKGKKFIDHAYEQGKVDLVRINTTQEPKLNNDKPTKPANSNKKTTDKR